MNGTIIVVVSVVCSLISAIASSVGLYFSGRRDRQTRRIATLRALHEFLKTTHAHKRALADCKDNPDALKQAFIDFIDFLEVCAAAHNDRLVSGAARQLLKDKIVDEIHAIEASTAHGSIREWYETSGALPKHLHRFMEEYYAETNARRRVRTDSRKIISTSRNEVPEHIPGQMGAIME